MGVGLYEISMIDKSIETDSRLVVAMGEGEVDWGVTAYRLWGFCL